MSILRRCRVNAALAIQMFSQLFHFINMWLLNKVLCETRPNLCTRQWGIRLKRRLSRIEAWSEKQGLELTADCHLSRIVQVVINYNSELLIVIFENVLDIYLLQFHLMFILHCFV